MWPSSKLMDSGHTLERCRYNRSPIDTTISKAEVSCAARTLCGTHHSVSFSDAIEIFRTPYMASHCVGSAAEEHRPRCRALLRVKSDIGISRRGPEDGKRTSYSPDGGRYTDDDERVWYICISARETETIR